MPLHCADPRMWKGGVGVASRGASGGVRPTETRGSAGRVATLTAPGEHKLVASFETEAFHQWQLAMCARGKEMHCRGCYRTQGKTGDLSWMNPAVARCYILAENA